MFRAFFVRNGEDKMMVVALEVFTIEPGELPKIQEAETTEFQNALNKKQLGVYDIESKAQLRNAIRKHIKSLYNENEYKITERDFPSLSKYSTILNMAFYVTHEPILEQIFERLQVSW